MESTPQRATPTVAGKQMSSKLREKLRRCGRYHCSPSLGKRSYLSDSPLATALPRADNSVTPTTEPKVSLLNDIDTTSSRSPAVAKGGGKRLFDSSSDEKSISVEVHSLPNSQDCDTNPQKVEHFGRRELCKSQTTCSTETYSLGQIPERYTVDKSRNVRESVTLPGVSNLIETPAKRLCHDTDIDIASEGDLVQQKKALERDITKKKETLRKLKMVKMYRAKNNLDQLEELIGKWREVSQQGLSDLHDKLPQPKPSLSQLVDHLQIEHQLIRFDKEEETFN